MTVSPMAARGQRTVQQRDFMPAEGVNGHAVQQRPIARACVDRQNTALSSIFAGNLVIGGRQPIIGRSLQLMHGWTIAVGELSFCCTPSPFSRSFNRECQQNDSLADGYMAGRTD